MAKFSDLPSEIRNALYDQLLRGQDRPQDVAQNELALFTVSKQLHAESASYFYQHNQFEVDTRSTPTDAATILPPIADQYLRFLRRLTLHIPIGPSNKTRTCRAASSIAALSATGAQFTELNLSLTSSMSHMLNSRVDDLTLDCEHPIAAAIRTVLSTNITKLVRIQVEDVWFASGVAQALQVDFGPQLELYHMEDRVDEPSELERSLTGRCSSTHLADLSLDPEEAIHVSALDVLDSPLSTPRSLPSSDYSALAELDTFSVSSFEFRSDEADATACDDPMKRDINIDSSEEPFFNDADIEEWSAFTQEEQGLSDDEMSDDAEDLDNDDDEEEDEDMEDVPNAEFQAIIDNMQEVAHHMANDEDVTYMTNFAPELLLSRHNLGHLL